MDENTKNLIGQGLQLAGRLFDTKPSEQALLAEYQVCQDEAGGAVSWSWQSGVIFFVTTLALAGTLISGLNNTQFNLYRILLICIFGEFSIILLFVWDRYLMRQNFIRRVLFRRMEMIERTLGLRKNLYVTFLDGTMKDNLLTLKEKKTLIEEFSKNKGRRPKGLKLTRIVVWSTISAWAIIIIIEMLIYFIPTLRSFLFDC